MRTSRSAPLVVSLVAAAAAAVVLPSRADAQVGPPRSFGLGLALGYPDVGVSAQIFLTQQRSIQITASFLYNSTHLGSDYAYSHSGIGLRGDFLFHPNVLLSGSAAKLEWYVGPGVFLGIATSTRPTCPPAATTCVNETPIALGLEAPIGLGVQFQGAPVDLGVELVPRLGIVDASGFDLTFGLAAALHVRYYF